MKFGVEYVLTIRLNESENKRQTVKRFAIKNYKTI